LVLVKSVWVTAGGCDHGHFKPALRTKPHGKEPRGVKGEGIESSPLLLQIGKIIVIRILQSAFGE
jgi:hypothetical protein